MDSALRIDSPALSGPMDKTVTSDPGLASAMSRPSSIAYSSSSLMSASTETRSSVESEDLSVRSDPVSGTCFTQTTIFMAPPAAMLLVSSQRVGLGGLYHIGQQHGAGHGADATWHRGYPACDFRYFRCHVAAQAAVGPGDADVHHRGARLDHVGGKQAGTARGDHHDV